MIAPNSHEQLLAQATELRRMAAKSPFKKDRDRFTALAEDCERRSARLARPLD